MKNQKKKSIIRKQITLAHITVLGMGLLWGCSLDTEKSNHQNLPPHPRIILNVENTKGMQEKMQTDSLLRQVHQLCLSMMSAPAASYEQVGRRLLATSRTVLKRLAFLGYAYQMTGDQKYCDRAEHEMLTAAAFDSWNPDHYLDVAEMTMALAIGYDWCFSGLSNTSKATIRNAIIEKGIRTSFADPEAWWLHADNNWSQVCQAGIAFGAWAVHDFLPDTAQMAIDRALRLIQNPEKAYAPDGAYPEGPMYWSYGTSFHALFADAYEHLYGNHQPLGLSEAFMKTGSFFLHSQGPTSVFNWGDCGDRKYFSPAAFWFAQKLQHSGILYNQMPLLKAFLLGENEISPLGHQHRLFPFISIWLSRQNDFQVKPPKETSWFGKGKVPVAFHRTSWVDEALFLAVKGGPPNISHAHMDAGQFVADANGVRWAFDLGGHDYHALEKEGLRMWDKHQESDRWKIFRYNNLSHNTLVVNNHLQNASGQCKIIENIDLPGYKATTVDMTEAFQNQLDSAVRTAAIMDEKYFLVKDYLENIDTAQRNVRWAFMTHDAVTLESASRALVRKNEKELRVEVIRPKGVRLRTYSAQPQELPAEHKNPGKIMLGFEMVLPPGGKDSLEVHLVPAL